MQGKWIVEHRREVMVLGDFEIAVHGNEYNGWAVRCDKLGIDDQQLTSKYFADAKDEALGIIAEEAQEQIELYKVIRERAVAVLRGDSQDD